MDVQRCLIFVNLEDVRKMSKQIICPRHAGSFIFGDMDKIQLAKGLKSSNLVKFALLVSDLAARLDIPNCDCVINLNCQPTKSITCTAPVALDAWVHQAWSFPSANRRKTSSWKFAQNEH